jgi:hypothetical protein
VAILDTEIKFYESVVNNETSSNGGRLSTNLANASWPNISSSNKASGITQYKKRFVKIDNADDLPAEDVRIGLQAPTTDDVKVYLVPATQTDIQSGFSTTLYGVGKLNAGVSAGASIITVLVEDGADIIFRNGGKIRISDMASTDAVTGNQEFHVINGAPSIAGDVVTITLTGTLANDYSASNTYVASMIEAGTVQASVGTPTVTSTAGTFDEAQMTAHSIGGLHETFTFTFTSATAFNCVGDTIGSVGSGNISSTFQPTNTGTGTALFTLPPAAWGGTFVAGDTVVVPTEPCAAPYVIKRIVPVGATNVSVFTNYENVFLEG